MLLQLSFANNAMGIFESNTIFYRVISTAAILGTMMCYGLYVYTPKITGLDMETQNAIYTYLGAPSSAATCKIRCSLTPRCLWASFTSDTGICAMSDSVCLRPTGHSESALFAMVHNVVSLGLCLTRCGLMTPYGYINRGQHWFR